MKQAFLLDRSFNDVNDLNRQVRPWLDTVGNFQPNETSGRIPVDAYEDEKPQMRSYGSFPLYDIRPNRLRLVHTKFHARIDCVYDSVNPVAIGKVWT